MDIREANNLSGQHRTDHPETGGRTTAPLLGLSLRPSGPIAVRTETAKAYSRISSAVTVQVAFTPAIRM